MIERFGPKRGQELADRVDALYSELFSISMTPVPRNYWEDKDVAFKRRLAEINLAIAELRRRHPDISDAAAARLANCKAGWLFRF